MSKIIPVVVKHFLKSKISFLPSPDFLFKTMSIFLKSNLGKIYQSDQQLEEKHLKNIKNNLQTLGNKLDRWYIFSHNKKTKMLKSKTHMLKLQKNIIKRYKITS